MMTAVLSSIGVRLMPTTCFRARKLIKSGKAVIHSYAPFTIRLTQRESGGTQPIEYCCDTGYQHIGISIKSVKHEYVGVQVDALKDEKKHHQDAMTYRRTRRNRKPNVENLHKYRQLKVSKGRVSVRRQHYPIQPDDTVIYEGRKRITKGVQNFGTYLKIGEKVVSIRKIRIHHYAGGYIRQLM